MKEGLREKYKNMELAELINKCKQDDFLAKEELIKRNEGIVYQTLYHLNYNRYDVPDIAQEVLFRMIKNIKNLKKTETFKFWLNQIIVNLFYDELRKKTRRIATISIDNAFSKQSDNETAVSIEISDETKMPEEKTLNKELDELIKKSINALPEQYRIVVVLREMQGLSYEEIAALTKQNIGTVRSRLSRARVMLQNKIKPYINNERGDK